MLVAGKFAWVPHVKIPVKYPWYSGKITRACRQFACILREMLAASTQVNLPVFTGKLQVTHVNCVLSIFAWELQVNLPVFARNFARTSFTVYMTKKISYSPIKASGFGRCENSNFKNFMKFKNLYIDANFITWKMANCENCVSQAREHMYLTEWSNHPSWMQLHVNNGKEQIDRNVCIN